MAPLETIKDIEMIEDIEIITFVSLGTTKVFSECPKQLNLFPKYDIAQSDT